MPAQRLAWLRSEESRLLDWGARAADDLGFAYLDERGVPDAARGHTLLVTARMTFVFALAAKRGRADAADLRDHGVRALHGHWRDAQRGGWVSRHGASDGRKSGYDHAFVLLAASAARASGADGEALFADAAATVLDRFWRNDEGAIVDSFAANWSDPEPYRGANANMHMVEGFIAAWSASHDPAWLDRAVQISDRIVGRAARERGWRVLEHFDESWRGLPEYSAEQPADQFRPYGYLVGHSFEWARLLVQLSDALESSGRLALPWLREAALGLWAHGLAAGWAADGRPGFVYSLDWSDRIVIDRRLHWVASEAAAAATLAADGVAGALEWGERVWDDIEARFADPVGSWHHELDADGRPTAEIWPGKGDVPLSGGVSQHRAGSAFGDYAAFSSGIATSCSVALRSFMECSLK